MSGIRVVENPRHAALLAAPIRQRILEALAEEGSATTLAHGLGIPRQLAAYHVRQLEQHGYVELVREEQRRGCVERIVRRTARYLVASNAVFGKAGLDPRKLKDKFSSEYLLAIAERMTQEVGLAQRAADAKGARLPTLSADVEVHLASPARREAFASELLDAVARVAAKYHDPRCPDGRSYRVVLGAYPIQGSHERKRKKAGTHPRAAR